MCYLKDSIMNKIIGFCVVMTFAALFHSCGSDEVEQDLNVHPTTTASSVAGTLTTESSVQVVKIGNRTITLVLDGNEAPPANHTRGIYAPPTPKPGEVGPFYSTGKTSRMSGKEYSNRKIFVGNNVWGLVPGIYFADVYITSNTIEIPEEYSNARIAFPNPAGFRDPSSTSTGVKWEMETGEGDKLTCTWRFYSFRITYNLLGQYLNRHIPIDPSKVQIPYFFK